MKAEKPGDPVKAPMKTPPVRRATDLVKKIEGGVLYTEKGRYPLTGVRVIDLTKDGPPSVGGQRAKTAEMIFIDEVLREVVIRQRQ